VRTPRIELLADHRRRCRRGRLASSRALAVETCQRPRTLFPRACVGQTRENQANAAAEHTKTEASKSAAAEMCAAPGALGGEMADMHPTTKGLPIADRDPQTYVENIETEPRRQPEDTSLGIGSLKGL